MQAKKQVIRELLLRPRDMPDREIHNRYNGNEESLTMTILSVCFKFAICG